jgi:IclR family transcriptional regulator, acetate operon repressor
MDIKTAGRTLDVFEAFETLSRPTTLTELASHIGAQISSCHGLLRTRRMRGTAERRTEPRR